MSDNKTRDDDEDLMSDFKDLFPDDEGSPSSDVADEQAAPGAPGEALDELDAFLDDFEKGFNPADEVESGGEAKASAEEASLDAELAAPLLTDEASTSGQEDSGSRGVSADLELGREELDLAMSEADAGEVFDDHWGEAEADEPGSSEPEEEVAAAESVEPEQESAVKEEQVEREPPVEVAAVAAGAPVAAAATHAASPPGLGRTMQWSVISVMLVALALSAVAAWLAFSTASEVEQLQRRVQAMQQAQAGTVQRDMPALSAMRTELRTLGARVNELAVVIEGPMTHLSQSNEGTLSDIEKRLAKLEAGDKAKPLVEKPAATRPAPAKKTTASPAARSPGGGWVINLISLSSEKDADAELKHLRSLGVRAEKQRAEKDGKVWYRLRVPGFTSYEGAKAYIDTIEKKTGVKQAWVARE